MEFANLDTNEVSSVIEEALVEMIDSAETAIAYGRQTVALFVQPKIVQLEFRLRSLGDERHRIIEEIGSYAAIAWLGPPWVKVMVAIFAVVFLIGGGAFGQLSIDPFGFGKAGWLLVIATAGVVAFAMHNMLHVLPPKVARIPHQP